MAVQLNAGGKKTAQNVGEGAVNTTGTNVPPCAGCGGRTTRASTRFWFLGFSSAIIVPSASGSGERIIAPF